MIRPAASFISGIIAFHFLPFFPFSINLLIILSTFFFYYFFGRKKAFFLCLSFFVFGILYSFIRHDPMPETKLPRKKASVTGVISGLPEFSGKNLSFILKNVSIDGHEIKGDARLYILSETAGESGVSLYAGDVIKATAELKAPAVFYNPGVYSYDPRREGITAAGYVKGLTVIKRGEGFLSQTGRIRQELCRITDNSLSPENAAFMNAITAGARRGISAGTRDSFSSTGLAHLLSISGTHFALLAFIVFQSVKRSAALLPDRTFKSMTLYLTPSQISVIATIPMIFFYALISGGSTPTIRSFIMVMVYMLAVFLGRRGQWLNSLAIAAFIILLREPGSLFDISFILSFTAVLSIGLFLERLNEEDLEFGTGTGKQRFGFKKVFQKIKVSFLMTLAPLLGTAPVIALCFKQFPLISPISNLIVTPLVCFVILPIGLFSEVISFLFNLDFLIFSGLTDALTGYSLHLARLLAQVPYSNLHIPDPPFLLILFYYASLFYILKGRSRMRFAPLILVIFIYAASPYLHRGEFRITFLDVGQGDSSVVRLPDGKVMVIDGGTPSPDAGRNIVAPYLWSQGIRKIDYLVLSHPHPDHYGGLSYILQNFRIGGIWTNKNGAEFFDAAKGLKTAVRRLKRGGLLEAEGYKIYALHPYDEFHAGSPRGSFSDENSDSLVLKVETDNGSVLFTGDIEAEAENDLIHLGAMLKSDIIKVPHHGGRTSSSPAFIKAVGPKLAVVSAGRDNPFKHPHYETVERYRHAGTGFYRTDRDGAVIIRVKPDRLKAETFSDSEFIKVRNWEDELRNLRLLFFA
ncbi:MAG: DNA internalization-related competence protein ComEC/Rec2 [Nitrospirae bacterium]|nr:DNA internalization-related competence protein ComEC/Rec2 [Nitrospirota bacterium]